MATTRVTGRQNNPGSVDGYIVASSGNQTVIKSNLTASTAPASGNDNTQSYAQGSLWYDTTAKRIYICENAATAAAVWKSLGTISWAQVTGITGTADSTTFLRGDGTYSNILTAGLTLGTKLTFSSTTTTTAANREIIAATGGIEHNTPTSTLHNFKVNGTSYLQVSNTGIVFPSVQTSPGSSAIGLWADASNLNLYVPTGMGYNFAVAGSTIGAWTATYFTINSTSGINFGSSTGTVTGSARQILGTSTGLYLNTPSSTNIILGINGTTAIQFNAQTGGTGHFLKQSTAGGAVSSAAIALTDLPGSLSQGPFLQYAPLSQQKAGIKPFTTVGSATLDNGSANANVPGGWAWTGTGTGAQASRAFVNGLIPVDTSKAYFGRVWAANTVNTAQLFYCGFRCFDHTGAVLGGGAYKYFIAYSVNPAAGGTWYTGTISGTGASGNQFEVGTKYVDIVILYGYGTPTGAWTTVFSTPEITEVTPVQYGGSGANLLATGGTSQIVKQSTTGGAFSVGTLTTTEVMVNWSGTKDGTTVMRGDGQMATAVTGAWQCGTYFGFTSSTTITAATKQIVSLSGGLGYNVATGNSHAFLVNGSTISSFDASLFTLAATNGIYLNSSSGSITAGNRQISGMATGITYNVPTGTYHSFTVNNVEVSRFDSTGFSITNDPQDWFMYVQNYYH